MLAAVISVVSCNMVDSQNGTEQEEGQVPEQAPGPEIDFSTFEQVPLQSKVENIQPMTGIVLWNTHSMSSSSPKYLQLEYSYMLYNQICKGKDVFDWTPMDNLLKQVASRGHQLVVRFRYSYVGQKCAVPDYIKKWPGYEETVGESEGKTTYFPDWRCEELQRFHHEFHRRFAERYDNDPRLAFVQTGFGLWAEYHIYDGPFILGKTFPSYKFQAEFFRKMEEYFKNTTWSISIDAADGTYSPLSTQPDLLNLRFGNFDDSFMHQTHDQYNRTCWLFFGEDRYKKAPRGGEFSYYSDYDQEHCLDKNGMYGRVFEDEVAKYHMTYILGNDQPGYQSKERIKEASMSMGYRFAVKDFRVKEDTAAVLISNVGVAPIYRKAYVAVDGVRGKYSLDRLMPQDEEWVVIQAPGLSSKSKVTIECDHLVAGQKIEFEADIK